MVAYEVLLMFDPDLPEGRQEEIVKRSRELVERGKGKWVRHDVWGRRRLAYEINHKGEGVYHLLLFKAAPATLAEVSRELDIQPSACGSGGDASRRGPPPPSRRTRTSSQSARCGKRISGFANSSGCWARSRWRSRFWRWT